LFPTGVLLVPEQDAVHSTFINVWKSRLNCRRRQPPIG
jgi:hypothetical protein